MNGALSWLECKLKIWRKNTKLCRKGYFVLCSYNHYFLLLQMVKCFWPLKDLNVLVEMLFVTIKNAIQDHNLQARNMCPRYQETALQGF